MGGHPASSPTPTLSHWRLPPLRLIPVFWENSLGILAPTQASTAPYRASFQHHHHHHHNNRPQTPLHESATLFRQSAYRLAPR